MSNTELLKKLYNNPKIGLSSLIPFKKTIKKLHPEITMKEVELFYKNLETVQLLKKPVVKTENFMKIVDEELTFQIDIIIFNKSQKQNNHGIFMFLTMIDVLSRFVFMEPLKTRNTNDIIKSYENIIKRMEKDYNKKPIKLISDDEFNNKEFLKLNEKLNINIDYQTAADDHFIGGNRLGIIDRFCRTIKSKVLKYQLSSGNINFIDVINDLIENYNNSSHRTLKDKSPNDYFENNKLQNNKKMNDILYNIDIKNNTNHLEIGDNVRAIIKKKIFDKENINFSKEIYTVYEIKGNKYKIKDDENNILRKLYKYEELQLINPEEVQKNEIKKKDVIKKIKELKTKEKINTELKKDDIKKDNIIQKKTRNTILKKTRQNTKI